MRLEIINGQKIYGKRPILNQLNLVFQSGKIYGLKGDNGSGKTVLLKVLAGYIKLDKGKVLQDGKVYGIKNPEFFGKFFKYFLKPMTFSLLFDIIIPPFSTFFINVENIHIYLGGTI